MSKLMEEFDDLKRGQKLSFECLRISGILSQRRGVNIVPAKLHPHPFSGKGKVCI